MMASMRTHKRKPSKFFTKDLIFHHNKLVDDIADYINQNIKESFCTFEEFRNVFLKESASWQEEFGNESPEDAEDFTKVIPTFFDSAEEKVIAPMKVFKKMVLPSKTEKKKTTQICLMKGKFFPFHNGHMTSVEDASSASGMKVFLVITRKKSSKFPEELHKQLMDEIVNSNSKIAGYIFSDGLSIFEIERDLPGKFTIGAFAGSQKECDDYQNQGGQNQVIRVEKHLSSKKVLQKIREEDIENFRKLVPKSLHNYFHKIKNEVSVE
jgi:nicotinic acid mononucleotide adenylyltransferase